MLCESYLSRIAINTHTPVCKTRTRTRACTYTPRPWCLPGSCRRDSGGPASLYSKSGLYWLSVLRADGDETRKFSKGKGCEYNRSFKNGKPKVCVLPGRTSATHCAPQASLHAGSSFPLRGTLNIYVLIYTYKTYIRPTSYSLQNIFHSLTN